MDQRFTAGDALEAVGGAKLRLLEARYGIGQQGRLARHVLQEQFRAGRVGVDVLEHLRSKVGRQRQRRLAAQATARQPRVLAQADQVALAQIEQRAIIDASVQSTAVQHVQLVAG
ncbi:hypothetical protein D3C84_885670 [compost metagenome]